MGLRDWWKSIGHGVDASDLIIAAGETDLSDESLYALAETLETPDPDTFVRSVRKELDTFHGDEWVKEHGSALQRFRRGVLIDEEKHPVLKQIFGF
jgi:hypothetical protein